MPPGTPGLAGAKKLKKLGLRASHTADVFLDDVRVPGRCLLGGKEALDERLARAREGSAPPDRPRCGPSSCPARRSAPRRIGIARAAYEYALEYAKNRVQFGRPIIENQAIAFALADMKMEIDAARLLVWRAAWMGRNEKPFTAGEGSMSKLKAGEVAVAVTEKAVQILGGAGYLREHPVERMFRDAKIYTIFEGTSRDPAAGHLPRDLRHADPVMRTPGPARPSSVPRHDARGAGCCSPGPPIRIARQFGELRRWGFGLAGELRQAAARDPDRVAVIDERRQPHVRGIARPVRSASARVLGVGAGDRVGRALPQLGRDDRDADRGRPSVGADPVLLNTGLSGPQLAAVARDQGLRASSSRLARVRPGRAGPGDRRGPARRADRARAGRPVAAAAAARPDDRADLGHHRRAEGCPAADARRVRSARLDHRPDPAARRDRAMMIAAPLFHTWGFAGLQIALALRATVVLRRRFDPAAALAAIDASSGAPR